MRYDITVANTSNVALENFYWHDRIPTDATRATVLTTGTYSARLNYRILYKTNYTTAYAVNTRAPGRLLRPPGSPSCVS